MGSASEGEFQNLFHKLLHIFRGITFKENSLKMQAIKQSR
jgi:hypothetical protein